ncbi:MAG: ABC transporter permease, partial [Pseudonocardiaceae bacterium]
LASKILVLGAVTGLQATVFTTLSLLGRYSPDDPLVLPAGHLEILVAVLGVSFTTMLIGLAISALIDNSDRGMPLLVLMVMAQLVCCGGLFPVHDRPVLEQLAWLAPARWAFAMVASTTDMATISSGPADPLWNHTATIWLADAAILAGIAIALVAMIAHHLTRLDPQRRAGRSS